MNEDQDARKAWEDILAAYKRHADKGTAEFHTVRRSIVSQKIPAVRSNYMGMSGRISVASLLAHMATIAPHIKPEEMLLNWATVMWYDAATGDEQREYDERVAAGVARQEMWERKQLVHLMDKHPDLVQSHLAQE